jgi:hypothetical protein
VPEVHAERVHPEVVSELRIPRGDVPGDPFIESTLGEQSKPRRQTLLPPLPFGGDVELRLRTE